jgi:hypothetical protein
LTISWLVGVWARTNRRKPCKPQVHTPHIWSVIPAPRCTQLVFPHAAFLADVPVWGVLTPRAEHSAMCLPAMMHCCVRQQTAASCAISAAISSDLQGQGTPCHLIATKVAGWQSSTADKSATSELNASQCTRPACNLCCCSAFRSTRNAQAAFCTVYTSSCRSSMLSRQASCGFTWSGKPLHLQQNWAHPASRWLDMPALQLVPVDLPPAGLHLGLPVLSCCGGL